jgi:hypothetical protein
LCEQSPTPQPSSSLLLPGLQLQETSIPTALPII